MARTGRIRHRSASARLAHRQAFHRGIAVRQHERRSRSGVLHRRDDRRSHHRSFQDLGLIRNRAKFGLYLQGQAHQGSRRRQGPGGALRARGQCAPCRRERAHQCAAHRRHDGRTSVGGALRWPSCRRIQSAGQGDGEDCRRARGRAVARGGEDENRTGHEKYRRIRRFPARLGTPAEKNTRGRRASRRFLRARFGARSGLRQSLCRSGPDLLGQQPRCDLQQAGRARYRSRRHQLRGRRHRVELSGARPRCAAVAGSQPEGAHAAANPAVRRSHTGGEGGRRARPQRSGGLRRADREPDLLGQSRGSDQTGRRIGPSRPESAGREAVPEGNGFLHHGESRGGPVERCNRSQAQSGADPLRGDPGRSPGRARANRRGACRPQDVSARTADVYDAQLDHVLLALRETRDRRAIRRQPARGRSERVTQALFRGLGKRPAEHRRDKRSRVR